MHAQISLHAQLDLHAMNSLWHLHVLICTCTTTYGMLSWRQIHVCTLNLQDIFCSMVTQGLKCLLQIE